MNSLNGSENVSGINSSMWIVSRCRLAGLERQTGAIKTLTMEPTFNPIKPIHGMIKFFLVCGLWPIKSKFRWAYLVYATIFHLIFTVAYIFFKFMNFFFETNLNLLTVGFFIFLAEVSLAVRISNLLINFEDITLCLDLVKTFYLRDENEVEVMVKNLSFFSRVMTIYIGCGTSACIFSWGAPMFASEPMLPYPAWYPIDWQHNVQSYWIAYFFQVCGVTFQAYGIILLQLFSVYLMAVIGAQLDVLQYRLRNLDNSNMDEGIFRNSAQSAESKFVECIKVHNEVLRLVKIVERTFALPFLVQFVTSSILFCFTAFQIATMNISDEMVSFVFYISFCGVFLNEIFLACYFGNEVILKNQNLSMAIYSSDWTNTSTKYRRMIILLIQSLNTPIVIKTGKIFTLTLTSFLTVINRSYSLFAVLQNTLS